MSASGRREPGDDVGVFHRIRPSPATGVTGGLSGVAGVAGSFAYGGPTTDFIAVPITDLVIAGTPGPITAAAIQSLGRGSEVLAFLTALGLAVAGIAVAAVVGARGGRALDPTAGPLLGAYFVTWTVAALVLWAPFPAVAVAVPPVAVVWYRRRQLAGGSDPPGRRAVLKAAGSVAVFSGVAAAVGLQRSTVETSPLAAIPADERDTIYRRLAEAEERSLSIEGIPGLVSRVGDFYEVDINPINPDVNATDWSFAVTGAVEEELTVEYGALTDRSFDHRFATLRCVGEPLNGHEMDTALWTGVAVAELLAKARPHSDCECVMLRAADGYYEEFPLAALEAGLLAIGMNGRLLPRKHGFPVRTLVPGHWGEVNVKWLTEIELLEREARGFWELRGWHGTGPVNTVAKLHAVNRLGDGRVQVGGHAYAGTRGIDRVEVSFDGGETWDRAELSAPLPDRDVWRQWAYTWEPAEADGQVVVRAVDGTGAVQPRKSRPAFPSGATGWVSRTIEP